MAGRFRRLRGVSIVRVSVLLDRERSDLRVQRADVCILGVLLDRQRLRLDYRVFAVRRASGLDETRRSGEFEGKKCLYFNSVPV